MKRMMKWFTWERQMWLVGGLVVLGLMLATATKQGIFSNIGWVLAGVVTIMHPVCPAAWQWKYGDDETRMKRDCRIGGAIVILIGCMIKFGV